MYLDLESYADYIAAYKTLMVDSARVMVRELGTSVTEEKLIMVRVHPLKLIISPPCRLLIRYLSSRPK
jgi:hypothetical protein